MTTFADELRKWWSFDDRQMHTHSWHSREDFIENVLPRLLKEVAAQEILIPEGFMLLPIEATAMMALRGYQTGNVFEKNDYFGDYVDANELPDALAPTHKFDDDERGWLLAAAAYRGCVAGYVETLRRLKKDPTDGIAISWNKPLASSSHISGTNLAAEPVKAG